MGFGKMKVIVSIKGVKPS